MNDLISRKAAIDAVEYWHGIDASEALERLPSAERTGRWLDTYNDGDWHCSECGAIVEKDEQIRHYWQRCYHCGAKMQQSEEL